VNSRLATSVLLSWTFSPLVPVAICIATFPPSGPQLHLSFFPGPSASQLGSKATLEHK
jgi:hypothetical protein